MEESEQKNAEQLWEELLDIVERQLEINTPLNKHWKDWHNFANP